MELITYILFTPLTNEKINQTIACIHYPTFLPSLSFFPSFQIESYIIFFNKSKANSTSIQASVLAHKTSFISCHKNLINIDGFINKLIHWRSYNNVVNKPMLIIPSVQTMVFKVVLRLNSKFNRWTDLPFQQVAHLIDAVKTSPISIYSFIVYFRVSSSPLLEIPRRQVCLN